jgi:hypothetical protein
MDLGHGRPGHDPDWHHTVGGWGWIELDIPALGHTRALVNVIHCPGSNSLAVGTRFRFQLISRDQIGKSPRNVAVEVIPGASGVP